MKISQDVRDYADENGLNTEDEAILKGFEEKSREAGSEIYL